MNLLILSALFLTVISLSLCAEEKPAKKDHPKKAIEKHVTKETTDQKQSTEPIPHPEKQFGVNRFNPYGPGNFGGQELAFVPLGYPYGYQNRRQDQNLGGLGDLDLGGISELLTQYLETLQANQNQNGEDNQQLGQDEDYGQAGRDIYAGDQRLQDQPLQGDQGQRAQGGGQFQRQGRQGNIGQGLNRGISRGFNGQGSRQFDERNPRNQGVQGSHDQRLEGYGQQLLPQNYNSFGYNGYNSPQLNQGYQGPLQGGYPQQQNTPYAVGNFPINPQQQALPGLAQGGQQLDNQYNRGYQPVLSQRQGLQNGIPLMPGLGNPRPNQIQALGALMPQNQGQPIFSNERNYEPGLRGQEGFYLPPGQMNNQFQGQQLEPGLQNFGRPTGPGLVLEPQIRRPGQGYVPSQGVPVPDLMRQGDFEDQGFRGDQAEDSGRFSEIRRQGQPFEQMQQLPVPSHQKQTDSNHRNSTSTTHK